MNEKEKDNIELKTQFPKLLNCQNNNGNTALNLAINNEQYELAKKLINYGAQTNIKNNNEEQALDLVLKPVFKILLNNEIFKK